MAKYREQRNNANVLEGYVKTSDGGNIPLDSSNSDYQEVLKWIAEGGISDPDTKVLAKVKNLKIQEYKTEGVRLIGLQVPEWNSIEAIGSIASVWNMLGTPNAAQAAAKNTFVYLKNTAIPAVSVLTTVADVQAVDVINDPNWPS